MKKIETKIAKNGTKMYYVEGKRVNREDAIETASMTRETPFTIEYTAYDTKIGEVVDKVITTENLQITIQPIAHKYDMGYHVLVRSEQIACKFGYKNDEEAVRLAKKNANATVDAIVEAYVTGAAGVKLAGNIVAVIRNEAYPDEYAVSDEALEVAINAEIELAKEAEREEIISNPLITEDAFEETYYGELMNAYNAEINPKKEAYYQALTEALLLKFTLEEFETAMLDTAVTAEAFEIAVDAETELANKASKTAKKNYSINPVIGEDDNMKLNHVDIYTKGNKVEISSCFECKNIETAYRRFRKIMIQIDADHPELQLGGENDWLPANKITLVSTGEKYEEHFCGYNENDDMIFSASPVEALAVDINEDWFYFYGKFTIETVKEETQMAPTDIIKLLYDENVDEVHKTHLVEDLRLASPDYRAKVVAAMITEKSVLKEQIESLKARFNEIQAEMIQANKTSGATFDWGTNRAEYHSNNQTALALLRRVNRLGYTLKQLGVGYPEQDAPLTIVANEKDYYKERVELADKIRRDAQPYGDNDVWNLIPNVDGNDDDDTDDELIDPPAEEPYRPFTVEDTIESLNHSINWAKGILATMQGDTYSDDWQDWTRSELETAITDWQSELAGFKTKPAEHTADSIMPALEIANNFIKDQKLTLDVNTDNLISYAGEDLRLNIFLADGKHTAVSVTSDEQPIAIVRIETPKLAPVEPLTLNSKQKRSIRDSLNHARTIALENIRSARRNHNYDAEKAERELYDMYNAALKELKEVA